MKKTIFALLMAFVVLGTTTSCVTRVDGGFVGVKTKKAGSDRGVQGTSVETGWVFYNPFIYKVVEWPTYTQTKDYEFYVTDKDGMRVGLSFSLNYNTSSVNAPKIYEEFRRDLDDLEEGALKTLVKEAVSSVSGEYKASEMYSKRSEFQETLDKAVKQSLGEKGFDVDIFALSPEIELPPSIVQSIDLKVKADQDALRKQQELAQTKADAAKREAAAQGEAKSLIALAEGRAKAAELEARANRAIAASITPNLLKLREIELKERKWDGKYPNTLVGGDADLLISTGGN